MKKLSILFYILALLVSQCGKVLAQTSSIHTINGNKAVFQITTDKSFTLTFVDTSEVHEVMMHLVYNSDSETHKLWMIKNVKTNDSYRIDTVDKFTLHDPIIYQELKNTLNKIAQNKLGIQRPVSDASISAIYLWLHHIRHFDDKAPLSGELILNEYIMVIKDKGIHEQYRDYYDRTGLVQKKANEYSSAIAKLEKQKVQKKELTDNILQAIKIDRDKLKTMLKDTAKQGLLKKVKKEQSELSDSVDKYYKTVSPIWEQLEPIMKKHNYVFSSYSLDSNYKKYNDQYQSIHTVYQPILTRNYQLLLDIENLETLIEDSSKYIEAIIILDKYKRQIERHFYKDIIDTFEIFRYKILAKDSLKQLYKTEKIHFVSSKIELDSLLKNLNPDLYERAQMNPREELLYSYATNLTSQIKYNVYDWNEIIKEIEGTNLASQNELNGLKANSIYKVDKVSLQFERGFLERIQVWITYNDKQEIFENIYAIGFSSINNYKTFKYVKLFGRNTTDVHPYIYLSDVIANYDNMLQNYTRDYCPADTAINNANPSGSEKILKLRNERLVNLFDSKIYTDLRGIAENQPNGLVQVEINKRFNLNTERHQIGATRSNYGRFNFLNLWGALTKIENKDKLLSLRNDKVIQNNVFLSPSYATTLDFLRYEMLSLGGELNLLLFDLPDSKFTIYADFGTRYGFTKVRDSVYEITNNVPVWDSGRFNEREAHTVTLFPRIKAEIFAEKRVGFTFSYQYNYTYLFSNNYFKQVASYAKSQTSSLLLDTRARGSHMMEVYVRIQASEDNDNKFFIRARLFLQQGDVNTSFSQLQLGYSYNLFYKK